MSTTTYLTIVNDAIKEAGLDLASFAADGSDFGTNTNAMMQRFKVWVSRAWKDIQQEAHDWDFMAEQAVVDIDPGFMFYTTDGSSIVDFQNSYPPGTSITIFDQDGTEAVTGINTLYVTDLTGNRTLNAPFGVMTLDTSGGVQLNFGLKPAAEYFGGTGTASGLTFSAGHITWCGATPAPPVNTSQMVLTGGDAATLDLGIIDLSAVDGGGNWTVVFPSEAIKTEYLQFIDAHGGIGNIHYVVPSAGTTGDGGSLTIPTFEAKAYIHSWKSFNFDNEEEDQDRDFIEDVQEIDFNSFRIVDFYKEAPSGEVPITYVPWEVFRTQYDVSSAPPGMPRVVSKDDVGRYRFYPHPYYTVTIKFDYVRTSQILTTFSDVIRGIEDEFCDIIMWKAIVYYGEYDEQPNMAMRATKNYKQLLSRLELKNRQKFHFRPHRLW